ncbi:hypothetical protein GCM10023318_31510 [Nocardia callitridis]|uniref:Uncharacterized protein n=1 Tax=Nocardia callitridis TaxID=648753 RepID=A0ABP9KBR5_9NOCA
MPWRDGPARTMPPVAPEAVAAAIVRALDRGRERVVYPSYSLLPLELPVIGRIVAAIGARRIDTAGAVNHAPR